MFAVPIDQSGLAGFVPVQRQTGSSVGRNIFGQKIEGLPSLTDRRNLAANQALDIGGTDIGGIPKPVKFFPGVDIDQHGIDPEADPPAPPTEGPETSTVDINLGENIEDLIDTASGKISESISRATSPEGWGYSDKGLTSLGSINIAGKNVDIGEQALSYGAKAAMTAILPSSMKAFIPLGADLLVSKALDKDIKGKDVLFSLGKGIVTLASSKLVIPLMVLEFITKLFSDDAEEEDPFSTEEDMAHSFGRGKDTLYSQYRDDTAADPAPPPPDPYGADELNIGILATEGPFGTDPSITPSDPGSGADGPGDSNGEDSGESGTPGCWVAGTKVLMADSTYCNIEDLKIGDMVMSFPETKKTRRWNTPLEPQPIISLLVDVHPEIWHLNDSMVSGTEWIIKGDGTAAIVQWLNIGDTVLGPDNNLIKVTRVEPAEGDLKKQIIYNFETKFNYSYTANNMRTLRGRAVRAPERGPWSEEYLSGDTNAYEGSMQDEYNKKFQKLAA